MGKRVFLLVGGAAAGMAAAGGLLLATDVIGRVGAWDVSAFRGLQLLADHPHVSGIAHRVARLPDPLPTTAMLATICAAGLAINRRREAGAALLLVGGASLISYVLKATLAHPRYQSMLGPDALSSDAFPSGHATTAMSLGLAGLLVAPPRWRPAAAIAATCYGLGVGVSLMILGRHYPSDVLGAFLVTGSVGMLTLAALRAFERGPKSSPALGWPLQLSAGAVDRRLIAVCGAIACGSIALALTRVGAIASFASSHTSAVVAAAGIGLASAALVYAVTAELEAG